MRGTRLSPLAVAILFIYTAMSHSGPSGSVVVWLGGPSYERDAVITFGRCDIVYIHCKHKGHCQVVTH